MNSYAHIDHETVDQIVILPEGKGANFIAETLDLAGLWVPAGDAQIGWIYQGGQLMPPEPEPAPGPVVPQVVTRRQGRLALLDVGKLDAVEQLIAAIEDPTQRRAAEIEYEADTWERGNAFLQFAWAQIGGTESELDELFALAATK